MCLSTGCSWLQPEIQEQPNACLWLREPFPRRHRLYLSSSCLVSPPNTMGEASQGAAGVAFGCPTLDCGELGSGRQGLTPHPDNHGAQPWLRALDLALRRQP